MKRDDILAKVAELIKDRFDYEGGITYDTQATDVDGWDSVAHVELIIEIEAEFGIRLTTGETADLPDVGALVVAIERHVNKKSGS